MTEQDQLTYNDFIVELASLMQQYGARKIMSDFRDHYPAFYEELKVQINRLPQKQPAALLRK
jgi:hypothetical protein